MIFEFSIMAAFREIGTDEEFVDLHEHLLLR